MRRVSRRRFVGAVAAAGALGVASTNVRGAQSAVAGTGKPALLGGAPVRTKPFPGWPVVEQNDHDGLLAVLHSGKWNRLDGTQARRFEQAWAGMLGAKHCLAAANGTSALIIALSALDIGPGDEVIVPPYTFIATVNAVLLHHAMPVFVDTDPETFQIDARKIEAAITPRTRCIMPVHLGGNACDMDAVLAIAHKHKIPVVEDACQAHLAEWRGRKVSTLGDFGCFSFQASKNLNSGEGGAAMTNSDELYARAESFHNNGRGTLDSGFSYMRNGANLRLTEFQAALLLSQLTRVDEQSRRRERNAEYLTAPLQEIPGIRPALQHDGCTRNAYHLYMFRYDKEAFAGLPRSRFLKAMHAEGVPCSGGYSPLNKDVFLKNTLGSRGFRAIYGDNVWADYQRRNACPANDRLCEEAVWLTQTMLLGPREDMDQIVEAVRKIQKHAADLKPT